MNLLFNVSPRKQAEKLLKIRLPEAIHEVQVHQERLTPLYEPHTIYMRLKADIEDYQALVYSLEMQPVQETEYRLLLPGKWKLPATVKLAWWQATDTTPETAMARKFGNEGWLLIKYEQGYAYLRVYLGIDA